MSFLRNVARPTNLGIESTNAVPFISTTSCTVPPESPQNANRNPFLSSNSTFSSTHNNQLQRTPSDPIKDLFGIHSKTGKGAR